MNRRSFVKAAGVASILVASGVYAGNLYRYDTPGPAPDDSGFERVETSIKVGFGAGFSLISFTHHDQEIIAEIEHLQNRYVVSSQDLSEWQIISSSI